MKAPPKILLALTCVAALSLAYPASVQAVPTTYKYTGNPYTFAEGDYTTSMFVTVILTLAQPLPPNLPGDTEVFPTAFTFFDGVQTITNSTAFLPLFAFVTDAAGHITDWNVFTTGPDFQAHIVTSGHMIQERFDEGFISDENRALNNEAPGTWSVVAVPDAGSTLSLMTLTLL